MTARQYRIKALTRRLVKMAGGLKVAAAATRVEKSQLGRYCSPAETDSFAPADVVDDLEREVGVRVVSPELGARDPGEPISDAADLSAMGLDLQHRLGQLSDAIRRATEDDHLSAAEIEELTREYQAMIVAARQGHDALCALHRPAPAADAEAPPAERARPKAVS